MSVPDDQDETLSIGSDAEDSVLWLGAGFSRCATNGRAPLMRDFFSTLDASSFPHLHRFLRARYADLAEANVEKVMQSLDQMLDSPLSPHTKRRILAGQDPLQVKRELAQ